MPRPAKWFLNKCNVKPKSRWRYAGLTPLFSRPCVDRFSVGFQKTADDEVERIDIMHIHCGLFVICFEREVEV